MNKLSQIADLALVTMSFATMVGIFVGLNLA
jgi:hypothetical protein